VLQYDILRGQLIKYKAISINYHHCVPVFLPWLPSSQIHSSVLHYIFVTGHIFPHCITYGTVLGKGLLNREGVF